MDLLSDSDPICCLFTKNNDTGEFDLSGKTELIMNNHNPDFLETFTVNHYAKKVQQMDFRVYDADDAKGVDFKDKDLLGHSLITMDELLVRQGEDVQFVMIKDGKGLERNASIILNAVR